MSKSNWKSYVHERDCGKCRICGSNNHITVHHKLPKARGGKGTLENCVCWCRDCHRNYHNRWGLTTSDDYGNPVGEFRSANKVHKKKNRRRR